MLFCLFFFPSLSLARWVQQLAPILSKLSKRWELFFFCIFYPEIYSDKPTLNLHYNAECFYYKIQVQIQVQSKKQQLKPFQQFEIFENSSRNVSSLVFPLRYISPENRRGMELELKRTNVREEVDVNVFIRDRQKEIEMGDDSN